MEVYVGNSQTGFLPNLLLDSKKTCQHMLWGVDVFFLSEIVGAKGYMDSKWCKALESQKPGHAANLVTGREPTIPVALRFLRGNTQTKNTTGLVDSPPYLVRSRAQWV